MYPLRWRLFWTGSGWLMVAGTVVLSLVPAPPGPPGVSDKLVHALVYATLALWFCGIYHQARHLMIGLWLAGLGLALEFLQGLGQTRHPEMADALANAAGVLAAITLARVGLGGWCERAENWLSALHGGH